MVSLVISFLRRSKKISSVPGSSLGRRSPARHGVNHKSVRVSGSVLWSHNAVMNWGCYLGYRWSVPYRRWLALWPPGRCRLLSGVWSYRWRGRWCRGRGRSYPGPLIGCQEVGSPGKDRTVNSSRDVEHQKGFNGGHGVRTCTLTSCWVTSRASEVIL